MSLDLDPSLVALLSIVGAVTGVLALLLAVVALTKVRSLRRSYSVLQGDGEAESFVRVVERKTAQVQQLQQQVADTVQLVESLQLDLHDAIRHVSVVRYDAFNDMGGRMSFTAALLDDTGDGLVITSINGRSETRTYAKGVKAGASDASLSPEEQQAITYARQGPQ
ncbi:MAG: DUF4446 family protein [Actinomycetes bacterium]